MIARPEQRDTFANDYHSGLARTSAPNDSLQREYTVARLQECLLCLKTADDLQPNWGVSALTTNAASGCHEDLKCMQVQESFAKQRYTL